ncbi:MAG TPA: hypothetical protein VIE66_11700 [Methylocella sp.]
MTELTHRQMTVLSGAAQRDDGAAILPNAMKPASRARLSQTLMAQDLIREVRTKSKMPIWRRDAAGRSLGSPIPWNWCRCRATQTSRRLSRYGASASTGPPGICSPLQNPPMMAAKEPD